MKKQRYAISPMREEDFPEWYQQVIKASDMAEHAPVRGCMTIKPWGWSIWEGIRDWLDGRIKATGHQNAYFPLLVPLSFLNKESSHVEGFAKECAIVTHHRLEEKDGQLVPVAPLEEPLVIRPTSEAVVGEAFSRWVSSWRDLPLKINQWANVVRWEMRPRLFLRTAEFLWQEGHTVHATKKEAWDETVLMLGEYKTLFEKLLAIPVIAGRKSPGERFPGADETLTLECMTQDRKAIQCCTSHYLGQNFAKAFGIRFNSQEGDMHYGYMTSWGVTTRIIGAMIMVHGDDNGLVLPPRIAPHHVVIIPVLTKSQDEVMKACRELKESLQTSSFEGEVIRVHIDERDERAGEKNWSWIKKGVPIRVEIGPRDVENGACMVSLRSDLEKRPMALSLFVEQSIEMLKAYQNQLFDRAKNFLEQYVCSNISSLEEMKTFFSSSEGGFVRAPWCEDEESEKLLKEFQVTIRCIPLDQPETFGKCVLTGRPATCEAIFGKAY